MNILFIGADDLRMNIGAYGDRLAATPNIDALAAEGMVFTKAYVQFASCNASRASMLTGMRPDSIGVYKLTTHFREATPDAVTLPQFFKQHGYHTESIGKVYHNYGDLHDDISWSVPARLNQESHFQDYVLDSSLEPGARMGVATEAPVYQGDKYIDDRIRSDAVQTIGRLAENGQPFFLAVGFMKPHSPFNAPRRFWDMYKREDMKALGPETRPEGTPKRNWFHFKELRNLTDLPVQGAFSDETAQRLRHGYYAATSYLDDNVRHVIGALRDNGLYDNTIIVFWSDHGYHLGENGHWTKATNRELDTRTPLILRVPGQEPARTSALTEFIDIYPTLADLAELPVPEGLDGTSVARVFADPTFSGRSHVISQASRPWPGNKPITHMGYSLRTNEFRYTRWIEWQTGKIASEEVFHTERDPLERQNLVGIINANKLDELRNLLDQHIELQTAENSQNPRLQTLGADPGPRDVQRNLK